MKKLYPFLSFVLCLFSAQAQIVTIPDIKFKNALIDRGVDTNNDNQIQLSEALAVTNLDITNFGGLSAAITDMTGIRSFANLQVLWCDGHNFATLDVSGMSNLTSLTFAQSGTTSANLTGLTHLQQLNTVMNPIASLDLSALTNLRIINAYGCFQMTSINVSNLTQLEYLNCSQNNLSQLDVSDLVNLTDLQCAGNALTVLDLTNTTKLQSLDAQDNLFPTIDLSHVTSSNANFYVGGNPNLVSINIKNGGLNVLGWDNVTWCPNLQYICTDDSERLNIENGLLAAGATNISINSYCSFELGGNHNTISGTVRYDLFADGCDASDTAMPNIRINVSDSSQSGAIFTTSDGSYDLSANTGSFTLTPVLDNNNFTITPTSATVNFNASNNLTETHNFCLTPIGIVYEPEITILPLKPARPGFDTQYRIIYKNKGNQILNGNVTLNFNDSVLDFLTATTDCSQNTNNLIWNFQGLMPFETRVIDITFNLNSPMASPPVNIDDLLVFTATIQVNGQDSAPVTDSFVFTQTVVGAYDPNDKTCLEGNTINPSMIGDYLNYVIRFQNSGNYEAENVVVKDVIDTAKYDIPSLQLTGSSHPQTTRINGNTVEFIFESIHLPAEQNDEPGSHGFVAFKIKTKNNLTVGSSVSNKADIFFDYNFPITTEPATSIFTLLANRQFEDQSVSVTPNPATDRLTIRAQDTITSVQLYDLQGRLIETTTPNDKIVTFDLTNHSAGIYLVKITTQNGSRTEKIIKQ